MLSHTIVIESFQPKLHVIEFNQKLGNNIYLIYLINMYNNDNSSSKKRLKHYGYNSQDEDISLNTSTHNNDNSASYKQQKYHDCKNQDKDTHPSV